MRENSRANPGRRRDIVRYGGEELLAVLTKTTIHDAESYANKMRELVSARNFCYGDKPIQLTLSAGVSHFDIAYDFEKTPERLLKEADIALYAAKKLGRDRVCLFQGTHSLVSK